MKTLGASIVQRGIASVSDVEEALARQVMYGGDLATNLLELAAVSEEELTHLLATSHGIQPAPSGELPSAAPSVLRLVPGDLASRHGLYPLGEAGGRLTVAVAEPLAREVEQDLCFALGVSIVQLAAPLVRIQQAVARDYNVPLDARTDRIIAKLKGGPTSLSEPPRVDFGSLPRPETLPPSAYASDGAIDMEARTGPPPEVYPISGPNTDALLARTLVNDTERDGPPSEPSAEGETAAAAEASTTTRTDEPPAQAASQAAAESTLPRLRSDLSALKQAAAGLAQKSAGQGRAQRRLGPYTAADAERDLMNSEDRDGVLAAFFDFAAQYFEYCALFVMHSDLAEGRDARGPGASRKEVRALGIPLDLPSAIATAYQRGKFQLVRLTGGGIDAGLAKDLHRPSGPQCLLLPILMRKRCVLILYGDHGDNDVSLTDVGDVISFAPLVAVGLERVILKRKRSLTQRDSSLPVPAPEPRPSQVPLPSKAERARALAGILDSGQNKPGTHSDLQAAPAPAVAAKATPQAAAGMSPRAGSDDAGVPTRQAPSSAPAPQPGTTLQTAARAAGVSRAPLAHSSTPNMPSASQQPSTDPEPLAPTYKSDAPPAPRRELPPTRRMKMRKLDWSVPPTGPARKAEQANVLGVAHAEADAAEPLDPDEVEEVESPNRASVIPQPVLSIEPPPVDDGSEVSRTQVSPRSSDGARHATGSEAQPLAVDTAQNEPPEDGWELESNQLRRSSNAPPPEIDVQPAEIDPELASAIESEQGAEGEQSAPLAPASRSVSYSARPPSARYSSEELRLPSVIVDFESDSRALVERMCRGDGEAAEKLVELGAAAVSALVAEFPGPLTSQPRPDSDVPQRASDCGPILRTLARIGTPAVPFLVVRTADVQAPIRAWSTRLLGELPTRESGHAVARRLVDSNAEVRQSALVAARLQQREPIAAAAIREYLSDLAQDSSRSTNTRRAALEALREIRDTSAIPLFIRMLDDVNTELSSEAHTSLSVMARTDLGSEAPAWEKWWRANKDRHRIEWLIDALMHDDPNIRRAAGDELKSVTKEYFGYYDDLPKKERAGAQARYLQWWEATGRVRFA